jgi:hypothetical protein
MKALLISLFLTGIVNSFAQVCTCAETTVKKNQERSKAKHTTSFSSFHVKSKAITPEVMYQWQHRYSSKTQNISTKPDSPREHGTPEDTVYILHGYLWMVKIEDNDCDFHMEVGPRDKSKTRMIVEIPKENKTAQEKVRKHLDALNLKIKGCTGTGETHFDKGIPIIIRGVGFYDASHKPNTNHGDEHTKKYSWELHPAETVMFPK